MPATPEDPIAALIAPFGEPEQKLFQALRKAMRRRFPTANELVYTYRGKAVIGYSPTLAGGEGIPALSLDATGVRLYLTQGALLPDTHKLLHGKAGARFLVPDSAKDLVRPEVEALFAAAEKIAKVPLKTVGRGELILKESAVRKRPAKPIKR
ncbi:MAG: hypothetical protein ACO1NQ_13070 [Flavobacteriales bacterium]